MRYFILCFLALLSIISIFFSCHQKNNSVVTLQQAELMLAERPDSALVLLNVINSASLSISDNARYCLLMTEAMIKNSIPITSDSLIDVALNYFKDKEDSAIQAKTYFYAGRVSQEMQNAKQAMDFFLKAADFAENSVDYNLKYLIYYYLSDLYVNENLYDLALDTQQKAYYYSHLLNNKTYMAYARRNIAISYTAKGNNDSALNFYYQALNILPATDTATLITLYNEIGSIYNHRSDYFHANQFVNKAIGLKPVGVRLFYCYVIKAEIYFNLQQYDSAIYYYNKTIQSPNQYTRASSYSRLASLYSVKGDYKGAFKLMQIFNVCRDSIDTQTKSAAIVEMENIYQHGKSKEKIQHLILEKQEQTIRYYRLGIFSIVLLLLLAATFFVYRNRKRKELLEKSKILLEQENKLIRLRQKETQLREVFFKKLNSIKQIPSLSSTKDGADIFLSATKILLTDKEWAELIKNIDVAYDHFTDRLMNTYPNLSIQEVHLCCLVKIKVARNDLANIFCMTPQSVKTTKYRIKKDKMGIIDKNMTLDIFLEEF